MRSKLRLSLVLVAAACCAAGCPKNGSQDGASAGPPELQAMATPAFAEVPMPVGFKYDKDRSRSATWAGGEYVDHYYTGPANWSAVARFYRRQMPLSGWVRGSEEQSTGGVTNQEYERQGKTCRVSISDGGLFVGAEVHVTVFPNPQAKAPPGATK